MTENDTNTGVKARVENLLESYFSDRVYAVEDGLVWVSGMNAHSKTVAERMAKRLVANDIPCGLVHDDDAVNFGGVQFIFHDYKTTDKQQ